MPRTGLTSEQLKDKAIDYAITQMQLVGFNRVTLSDIAKALGVSHAALYGHFADKAALFDAVSERWLARLESEQEALCTAKKSGDAVERLVQWFMQLHRAKVEKVKHEPELFKAFNYSAQTEKPFVKKHMATMHNQLSTIVGQAIDSGLIQAESVDAVVALLFAATIGFHHPALVAISVDENREPLLEKLLDTLIDGLRV
jgi:AcrR family transcriptional regulator